MERAHALLKACVSFSGSQILPSVTVFIVAHQDIFYEWVHGGDELPKWLR